MKNPFLPYLPIEKIRDAFAKALGNELDSGKILSPESSAALAANTFGLFLDRPSSLPQNPESNYLTGRQNASTLSIARDSLGRADDTLGLTHLLRRQPTS